MLRPAAEPITRKDTAVPPPRGGDELPSPGLVEASFRDEPSESIANQQVADHQNKLRRSEWMAT